MPPICDLHHVFFTYDTLGLLSCPRCRKTRPIVTFAPAVWKDQEADVNDYKRHDHIYPKLHGTGGIGPGAWKRHGLAMAQEEHAVQKRARALHIVKVVRATALAVQNLQRYRRHPVHP